MKRFFLLSILCGLAVIASPQITKQVVQLSMDEMKDEFGDKSGGRVVHINMDRTFIQPPYIVKLSVWREKDPFHPKNNVNNIKSADDIKWDALMPLTLSQYKESRGVVGYDEDPSKYETHPYLTFERKNKAVFDIELPYFVFIDETIFDTPEKKTQCISVSFFIKAAICTGNANNEILTNSAVLHTTRIFNNDVPAPKQKLLGTDDLSDLLGDDENEEPECFPLVMIADKLIYSSFDDGQYSIYKSTLSQYGINDKSILNDGVNIKRSNIKFKDGCQIMTSIYRGKLNNFISRVTFSRISDEAQHHLCDYLTDMNQLGYKKVRREGRTDYFKSSTSPSENLYSTAKIVHRANGSVGSVSFMVNMKDKGEITEEPKEDGDSCTLPPPFFETDSIYIPPHEIKSHKHEYMTSISFGIPQEVKFKKTVQFAFPKEVKVSCDDNEMIFTRLQSDLGNNVYICNDGLGGFGTIEDAEQYVAELNDSLQKAEAGYVVRLATKKEVS